ncbi:phosphatidylinositol-specific phospholipase C/glycerophosphodiester phosphodiesterase family protein [Pirellulaceae bacterium SH467]
MTTPIAHHLFSPWIRLSIVCMLAIGLVCPISCAQDSSGQPGSEPLASKANTKYMPFAHAHNDYLHRRPLLDALESGFASVEADVFLVDGDLCVAHTAAEIDRAKTLRSLYLEPLRQIVEKNDGRVHAGVEQPLVLLIDIKSDGKKTFAELHRQLLAYRSILVVRGSDEDRRQGAVQVIVSGNRPFEDIESASPRLATLDGRLSDLGRQKPSDFYPLISDNWNLHFRWRGVGEIGQEDLQKLRSIVQSVHSEGKKIRFWAIPDREEVWRLLHREGVDFVNTDRLADLQAALGASDSLRK